MTAEQAIAAVKKIYDSLKSKTIRLDVVVRASGDTYVLKSGGPPIPTAAGGFRRAGIPLLVGERGPEIFVPNTAGNVVPNHKLGTMSGGVLNIGEMYFVINNQMDIEEAGNSIVGVMANRFAG
jgi:phage-related minor tail protein